MTVIQVLEVETKKMEKRKDESENACLYTKCIVSLKYNESHFYGTYRPDIRY